MDHKKKSASIFLISFATGISRILGLIREQIFAALFGATNLADAFLVAFRISNLLRDLFAEGALSTAFIPTFSDYLINRGKEDAFKLANLVINFLIFVIGIIIIAGFIYTGDIVKFIAPGFLDVASKFKVTVTMTRILLPFLLFVSIASVFMGMLNVYNKFFLPALAPALFNVIIIITGIILFYFTPNDTEKIIIWSVGALIGGFIQLIIQIPMAVKLGYKYKALLDLFLKDSGLRRIIKLMIPAVIGLAATQINIIVNTNLASFLAAGSIAYLLYAFRLIQLPIGIFGVSIATVNTAAISKDVAKNDISALKKNIAFSLKLNSFLTFPATFGLLFLGMPIIKLIFQHGRFTEINTINTYSALLYYSPTLFFYAGVKILAPVFYAVKKSYIPVISSFIAVAANLIISLLTYKIYGIKGLAAGLTSASVVNFIFLTIMFISFFGIIKNQKILFSIVLHIIMSVITAVSAAFILKMLNNINFYIAVMSVLVYSVLIYLFLSYIFKIEEFHNFLKMFKGKFLNGNKNSSSKKIKK